MIKQLYRFLNPRFQNVFLDYKVDQRPRYGHGSPAHNSLYKLINQKRKEYRDHLESTLEYKKDIWDIGTGKNYESDFSWNNDFLPGLDIAVLYTMMARYHPAHYIEIGSGTSTIVANKARKDHGIDTSIISIDPLPRTNIVSYVDHCIRQPLEKTDMELFTTLQRDDILFVDNSHRILPNSDSTVFFLEILPRLAQGVIVHIHDIYLPYDYPQFMCDRFYSEQYGLAIALLSNPDKFTILSPNYFISEDPELSDFICPLWDDKSMKGVERHGGSFWFKING